jgi:hypothetical protein
MSGTNDMQTPAQVAPQDLSREDMVGAHHTALMGAVQAGPLGPAVEPAQALAQAGEWPALCLWLLGLYVRAKDHEATQAEQAATKPASFPAPGGVH